MELNLLMSVHLCHYIGMLHPPTPPPLFLIRWIAHVFLWVMVYSPSSSWLVSARLS